MNDLLNSILPYGETTDMVLVTRLHKIIQNKELSIKLLSEYNFWYNNSEQVFWSENHFIMNVSSEYILKVNCNELISTNLVDRLHAFLDTKINIGFAEFLSPVYLPFTITSLLNLYDYSNNNIIQDKCQILLDTLAYQILSVSLTNNLLISPSGRSYIRHRKSTWNHINYFTDFLIKGTNTINTGPEMALKEILSVTQYRPSNFVYVNFTKDRVITTINISKSFDELVSFIKDYPIDIFVSTLWSYGCYFPSNKKILQKVILFMDTYNLWNHPHFKALKKIRKIFCSVSCCSLFLLPLSKLLINVSSGAQLLNVSVYVCKEKNYCLSSTINYNEGLSTFQQSVLTLNLDGIPIWFSYGKISNGGLSGLGNNSANKELSTQRITPFIKQEKNKVVAIYKSKGTILNLYNNNCKPEIYWNKENFDETGVIDDYSFGVKNGTVVFYKIKKNEITLIVDILDNRSLTSVLY
jgi:hypothetical protein